MTHMSKEELRETIGSKLRQTIPEEHWAEFVYNLENLEVPVHVKLVMDHMGLTREEVIEVAREAFGMLPAGVVLGSFASTRLTAAKCPCCGCEMDAVTQALSNHEDASTQPKIGDFAICIKCASILQFETVNPPKYVQPPQDVLDSVPEPMRRAVSQIQAKVLVAQAKVKSR